MEKLTNRQDAGRKLAERLTNKELSEAVIAALPRGGIPVAASLGEELNLDFKTFVARKLGAPLNPEFAFGAIAEGHGTYIDARAVQMLGLTELEIKGRIAEAEDQMRQYVSEFRAESSLAWVKDKEVILVDDGVATGSTAIAAAQGLRNCGAKKVILVAPVIAPGSLVDERSDLIDEVIALLRPREFFAVGQWYEEFDQVEQDEALRILQKSRSFRPSSPDSSPKNPQRP